MRKLHRQQVGWLPRAFGGYEENFEPVGVCRMHYSPRTGEVLSDDEWVRVIRARAVLAAERRQAAERDRARFFAEALTALASAGNPGSMVFSMMLSSEDVLSHWERKRIMKAERNDRAKRVSGFGIGLATQGRRQKRLVRQETADEARAAVARERAAGWLRGWRVGEASWTDRRRRLANDYGPDTEPHRGNLVLLTDGTFRLERAAGDLRPADRAVEMLHRAAASGLGDLCAKQGLNVRPLAPETSRH
jgi:hypothetical protein